LRPEREIEYQDERVTTWKDVLNRFVQGYESNRPIYEAL